MCPKLARLYKERRCRIVITKALKLIALVFAVIIMGGLLYTCGMMIVLTR